MVTRNPSPISEGVIGQVKFFKPSEEYGFIKVFKPKNFGDDVFFHISDYKADQVYKDWWLKFDVVKTNRGMKAINMRRVSQPPEHELSGTSFNY